ncbi:hypothetical protein MJO28_002135 [Puccinia striiformis f. sp. tritici]|uniref:Uncharacterized protein n=1 Tax=Puccinia striiformis f. sp. tritici TaxID=168172 RepID=A0ACC0EVX6_9BASI|nr:hypothetical protein MJO28_002135 [Puccinia striiformis f. sp. tritici]
MAIYSKMVSSFWVMWCLMLPFSWANWDEATGHLRDYKPSNAWLSRNHPKLCSKNVQVSECARNTRLHFPDGCLLEMADVIVINSVQFKSNYLLPSQSNMLMIDTMDPYGICCAYTVAPSPRDFIADFTNANSFFWHNIGGMPGLGTNPIRDPQTGQPGYEGSDGVFHVGPPNYKLRQNGHDSHYPGFRLPPAWPPIKYPAWMSNQPAHPKCGVPNGPNLDPGQQKGGIYQPAPAAAYSPPRSPTLPF